MVCVHGLINVFAKHFRGERQVAYGTRHVGVDRKVDGAVGLTSTPVLAAEENVRVRRRLQIIVLQVLAFVARLNLIT